MPRAIASALLLVLGVVVAQAVTFSDNFNAGPSPLWSNSRGDWTATGGVYYAQSPNNNPATYSLLPYSLADLVVDVDVNSAQDGGIYLHSDSGIDNGVVLITGGGYTDDAGLYWHVITNGDWGGPLGLAFGQFTKGDDIHITVTVVGDTYSAYLNGSSTPATTITVDSGDFQGQVGLYDFSTQTFDNFQLTGGEVPEPASVTLLGGALLALAGALRRRAGSL